MDQLHTMPYEKYDEVSNFIIEYINCQNLGPDGGVLGKELIQLCQKQFSDNFDAEFAREERKAIVDALKRMRWEGVLDAYKLDNVMMFRLHTFNNKDRPNATACSLEDQENCIEQSGLSDLEDDVNIAEGLEENAEARRKSKQGTKTVLTNHGQGMPRPTPR